MTPRIKGHFWLDVEVFTRLSVNLGFSVSFKLAPYRITATKHHSDRS